ncbi:MAG: ABC transporter substrate-binding protein [Kordiimonadaceae bacterium]|nr:ABC transporter substrate-binding protein [Kordiimonadaceae bacterium]
MKKIYAFLCMLVIVASPLAAQSSTSTDRAADDAKGAVAFIAKLGEDTKAVWSDSNMTAAERSTAFRALFEKSTDIRLLARAMLGRHFRTINKEQRANYMAAMRNYIVAQFDGRMAQIGFKTIEVVGTKAASGKRGDIFVKTRITRDEGQAILADWRIRKKKGVFYIINLDFEGINLMITTRDVFASRVKRDGIEGLITWLQVEGGTVLTASADE